MVIVELFKLLLEQIYFIILIPIVLIIGSLIIFPFESLGDKFIAHQEKKKSTIFNNLVTGLGIIFFVGAPIAIVIYLFN